jgi:hypothetical protein
MTPMSRDTIRFPCDPKLVAIQHPGAILKSVNPAAKGIVIQREVLKVRDAVRCHVPDAAWTGYDGKDLRF